MTQKLDRNQCIHERPQKFFEERQRQILLILFRLLTMQCKCKCFFCINCLISIFRAPSTNKPLFKNNQRPGPHEQWKNRKLDTLAKLFQAMRRRTRPVTGLGHPVGRRVFWEGPKFFKLCPRILNYVQHIFSRGRFAPLQKMVTGLSRTITWQD